MGIYLHEFFTPFESDLRRISLSPPFPHFPHNLTSRVKRYKPGPSFPPTHSTGYACCQTIAALNNIMRMHLLPPIGWNVCDGRFVQLTDLGEAQCYDVGKQLRERYMPSSDTPEGTTTTIDGLTLWYDHDRVEVSGQSLPLCTFSIFCGCCWR